MNEDLIGVYAPVGTDISKSSMNVCAVETYCRELMLRDLFKFFNPATEYYKTNNFYAGYIDCEGIKDFTGSFSRIKRTVKKLFNINVEFYKTISYEEKYHKGLFFKYIPSDTCFYLTKPTVSALMLLMKYQQVLDYLLTRNTVELDLDTVLLRLLNRSKRIEDADYQYQLAYAIVYIKYYNTGKDALISTKYYNGCRSYMNELFKTAPASEKNKCREYIDGLLKQITCKDTEFKPSNPFNYL